MPLSDAKLRALKPKTTPYKLADYEGLYVLVSPSGSKLWRLAYRFGGKQNALALGAYPSVSLSAARALRDEVKAALARGENPAVTKKLNRIRSASNQNNTFGVVAAEWFSMNQTRWVTSYAVRLKARLDDDLLPALEHRPIAEIEPLEVLDAIRKIERRDAIEMAKRVMQMAGAIFRYGVATGRCDRDPTSDLKGALKPAAAVKHRSAMPAAELGGFLRQLEAYDGEPATRIALELILLTFVRTAELRFARWDEFEELDGALPLWRIPAEHMKRRRVHLVPLAPQAVALLRELKRTSRSPLLLPAATKTAVISENTLIYALYRLGYHGRATVHGFRSTASTVLNEHQFNRDWIEMQLAHFDGSVRGIYNAAEWLPGRRDMMCWWADHLDELRRTGAADGAKAAAAGLAATGGTRGRGRRLIKSADSVFRDFCARYRSSSPVGFDD